MKINFNNVIVIATAFLLSEGFRTYNIAMIIIGMVIGLGAIFLPIEDVTFSIKTDKVKK